MSHTPGPWKTADLDRRVVVGADGDSVVADVRSWRDTDDARLIAAAPEMLKALKLVLHLWDRPELDTAHMCDAMVDVQAAIAKAEDK